MHIVGTAGHVDHGKSSLVLALTGHNPDRLIEEQERGMTLDLGFAPLRFADGVEAGIIDVPGHERFLHNMLAGAAGMELVLLVIAANEGPKPQTLEHLQILNFLNVQRAIIVLTKIDLVDPHRRAIAAELARDACRGTVAGDAPLIGVSTTSGEGIAELKALIHETLAALPQRRVDVPAYMPVDRVFALPGHGTIITGTLTQGSIHAGDTLVLQPSGLPARVKSLQCFGHKLDAAHGGSRVAVNLPGIDVRQIARGETLVAARQFEPQQELEITFTPLGSALPMLRKRTAIRAHIGAAEIPGTLRFARAVPVESLPVKARLSLARPAVAYPGMRLIVRRMSPKDLLGGAVVGDGAATESSAATVLEASLQSELVAHAPGAAPQIIAQLQAANLRPLSAEKVATQTNVLLENARLALSWLVENGHAITLQKPTEYLASRAFDEAWQRAHTLLRELHQNAPWKAGLQVREIATALAIAEPLMIRLLNAWQADGRIANRAGRWHAPDFSPVLSKAQRAFFESVLAADSPGSLLPHSYQALLQAAQRALDLSEALDSLLTVGALVRVGDDVYRRSQIDRAKQLLASVLAKNGTATMAQLRDALGTSRKYALPLMEYLDSTGFTIRDGDLRRLRGK